MGVMGTKLLPATQVHNVIEQLVKSGVITGEKATRWQAKLENEEKLKTMRGKAEGGDVNMIYHLGLAYSIGDFGLSANRAESLTWFERGARLNDMRCLASC